MYIRKEKDAEKLPKENIFYINIYRLILIQYTSTYTTLKTHLNFSIFKNIHNLKLTS